MPLPAQRSRLKEPLKPTVANQPSTHNMKDKAKASQKPFHLKNVESRLKTLAVINRDKAAVCELGKNLAERERRKYRESRVHRPDVAPAIVELSPELPVLEPKKSRRSQKPLLETEQSKVRLPKPTMKVSCMETLRLSTDTSSTSQSRRSDYQAWAKTTHVCDSQVVESSSFVTSSLSQQLLFKKDLSKSTAETLKISEHRASQHSRKKINLNGPEWKPPCKPSVIEMAIPKHIGVCPEEMQKIARMSLPRQKFFLTQDPRRAQCLVNPLALNRKASQSKEQEVQSILKMAKEADNVCNVTEQTSHSSLVCEVIDLENPLNLDFQGMDYKNTYERDEQFFENNRQYRRIARLVDRRRAKNEAQEALEQDRLESRTKVPECFQIKDRNIPEPEPSEDSVRYGRLYRSDEKPLNKARVQAEKAGRRLRYKALLARKQKKEEEQRKEAQAAAEEKEKYKGAIIAAKDFDKTIEEIEDCIKHSFYKKMLITPMRHKRRDYPHNLEETKKFKKLLNQEKRIIRDMALVKADFYKERVGKEKLYPEAEMEINSDSKTNFEKRREKITNSEDSNDEDDMEVGADGSCFKLRGFHYRGNTLRGKFYQPQPSQKINAEKTCQTRDEWLHELVPKKTPVKLDIEVGIVKETSPDDPNLNLFHVKRRHSKPHMKRSAVRQFIEQRLGQHYVRSTRKNLKISRPRLPYHVKKFNLIKFLYTESDNKLQRMLIEEHERDLIPPLVETTTAAYIQEREQIRRMEKDVERAKRLQVLGLPCITKKRSDMITECDSSGDSSSSDLVPIPEPEVEGKLEEYERKMAARLAEQKGIKRLTLREAGNMPAPLYRESTLRRHPRYPRNYAELRVPSAIFEETVKKTGVPHMLKLKGDKMVYENVWQRKAGYLNLFGGRHHHDHWNPLQSQTVDVHYQPRIAEPKFSALQSKAGKSVFENFVKANPPSKAHIDKDLTLPRYDFETMIEEHKAEKRKAHRESTGDVILDMCGVRDFIFHSRSRQSLEKEDFPGRQKYLDFLQQVRKTLLKEREDSRVGFEEGDGKLAINKEEFIKELEEDLNSIESCLSSLSDSECTNFTNDSGSFLLMEGVTKVPLDYIRKSLVPFEELNRSRFQAKPIDIDVQYTNPFQLVPFSGQLKEQIATTAPKDTFFTYSTRLNNGLRERLEVPVADVRKKLIGRGAHKYPCAVTTDIDAKYVSLLKDRPAVKNFHFKTGRDLLKNALRMKFESMVIQGQVVRAKIYNRLNEKHWDRMEKTRILYEKLFAKWEKREYESTMSMVYQLKVFYEITDRLREESRKLDAALNMLTMDIVFAEGILIRRIMLQNFHYLLADSKWRYDHDWMHRIEGTNELEGYEESIAKRPTVFIRPRDRDNVWAVKEFFDANYAKAKHPRRIVFPDVASFMNGIENLKRKTFTLLLELHYTMSLHTELEGRAYELERWCTGELRSKDTYAQTKFSKHRFMEQRARDLKACTRSFIEKPVEDSFNDPVYNKDRAAIAEVWRQIVPPGMRGAGDEQMEPSEMVAMICDVVMQLIGAFETLPMEKTRKVEAAIRRRYQRMRKISAHAYQVESRIKVEIKNIERNLAPPYQKPRCKVGKLARYYLKKKRVKEVKTERHISEHTKFFFRAFHDEGDVMHAADARDSLEEVDKMQEHIVPFYFDHFLKLNGYSPNYNFKTQVELRDGNEVERFKVKRLVPEVMEKIEHWEKQRRRFMEESIARNPQLYENVIF